MTLRSCIYKGCNNYINLKDRSLNNVKLFSFPKNSERRKKWMELGKVPAYLPDSMYYFCSDHFDRKFLAINNRRTVLVGEALPFPHAEIEIDEPNSGEADFNYLVYGLDSSNNRNKQDYTNEQDIVVESTTITNEIQDNLDEHQFDTLNKEVPEEYVIFSDDESIKEEPVAVVNINKRKSENAFEHSPSSKPKIVKISQVQKPLQNSEKENESITPVSNVSAIKTNTSSNEETCEDYKTLSELVDAEHVTTFIFKSQEYVQMPKDYYLKEKFELMKKLQEMQGVLQIIKGHIASLDI